MDPYIGKLLDDRYEILSVLGTGGMAVVYRAYCHRLNRYVAVKILKAELAADQDLRRRFHDESQAVAMLSHPNIVAVYDISQVDGREFIVMELIDGITLKQYINKRGGCLNWRESLHFITQIMQGLKHAHSRGIIHRDIKPQNVMVLRDGSVKVTDFGIARTTNSQATMTQDAIGSVHYISPEQAKGSHIDARSDIYSAGVVLYEMLTGRLPFEGDNPVSVAIQHINSIPVSPRELNPDIPVGLEQITMKAMASTPDRRYRSAEDMLNDLDAFRRNPEVDFGYDQPGVLAPDEDEPTMILRKATAPTRNYDPDATVREPLRQRAAVSAGARFQQDEPEYDDEEYDEDYDDAETAARRKNRIFIGVAAGSAVLLIVILATLWFTVFSKMLTPKEPLIVPPYVGMTLEDAEKALEADTKLSEHFTIRVGEYKADETVEKGVVISQTPEGGSTVNGKKKTEIVLVVSSGPEESEPKEFELEDYTNQDYRLALSKLQAQLIVVTVESQFSDTVKEGMVISTNPSAGTKLKAGDKVTITYSSGPENKEVKMTSLLGLTEEDARNAIAAMKLTLKSVSSEYSDEYAEGKVCYQSIPRDITVSSGSEISIKISLGPKPEEKPVEPPTQPETPEKPPVAPLAKTTFRVSLPDNRTADSVVEIYVNGVLLAHQTVPTTEEEFSVTYEGTINSYSVKVDGSDYQDYDIINN